MQDNTPDTPHDNGSGDSNPFSYRRYQPHPALRSYVDYYYVFKTRNEHLHVPPQTLVPPNHPLLLFNVGVDLDIRNLNGDAISLPRSLISGFSTGSSRFLTSPGVDTIGVFFRAEGLGQLLNIPMSTLTNQVFDARDIFGNSVREVSEKLHEEPDIPNRMKIIDSFLLTCLNSDLADNKLISRVIYAMYENNGLSSIKDVSEQFQISRQHLHRIFIKSLGVSPKIFVRLLRFHHLINLFKRHPKKGWHDILFNSGFYDQAHMIREFNAIIGGPPTSVSDQDLFVSDFYIKP